MKSFKLTSRLTAVCIATALTLSIPGVGTAGLFDQAKSRVQSAKVKVTSKVRNVAQNMTDMEIIEKVKELHLKEQLMEAIELMQQMQLDYDYFSGGSGCSAECANFRVELKGIVSDFLSLVYEVPVLNTDGALISNLERTLNVIDYIPPRALYLMWQTFDGQLAQIRTGFSDIRQQLSRLPSLEADTAEMQSPNTYDTSNRGNLTNNSNTRGAAFCGWVSDDDKPFVELFQARLEMFAWRLKSVADIIPDVEVEGEAGAAAGVFGSAGAGIKPTDQVKMLLQMIAYVPERINWAIKINTLRAQVGCKIAGQ